VTFTVHHTCKKEGGKEGVIKNFPFLSEYSPSEGNTPFLGQGYYFWDFNLDYAKVWGKNHYNGNFYVCESNIEIDHEIDGFLLDLAGNLIHEEGTAGIDLCWIIDYLRTQCPPEAFPFDVIRAVDYNNDELLGIKVVFNENKKSYTVLNPRIIIAFKCKEKIVHLNEPFIVFESL